MPRYQWARIGVKGAILRNRRLLLLRRRDDAALYPSLWDLPGGGVEVGDALEEALVREIREETGFIARVGRPLHVSIVHSRVILGRKVPGVLVCYECSIRSKGPPRLDRREHTEFAWVSPDAIDRYPVPPNQVDAVRKALALGFTTAS